MCEFLGTFTKLRKETISFIMSVCLSVRPSARNYSAPTGGPFMKYGLSIFRKSAKEIQVSLKSE